MERKFGKTFHFAFEEVQWYKICCNVFTCTLEDRDDKDLNNCLLIAVWS